MMENAAEFTRLLGALRPWLWRVVVVGGWAHRLHRYHPLAAPQLHAPLSTLDADVALSEREPTPGDIREALTTAGFRPELRGEDRPPVARYRLRDSGTGFYVEFIAPQRGSGTRRDGTADNTVRIGTITAQRLRAVEILLVEPWELRPGREVWTAPGAPPEVRVANPVSFLAQKVLVMESREPAKRAGDVLYVHDTIQTFGDALGELRERWTERIRPRLPATTARRVEECARKHFAGMDAAVRSAARIPADRGLDPERVLEVCAYGMERIFAAGAGG